jgi:hypothetical protein
LLVNNVLKSVSYFLENTPHLCYKVNRSTAFNKIIAVCSGQNETHLVKNRKSLNIAADGLILFTTLSTDDVLSSRRKGMILGYCIARLVKVYRIT